jgi:hypothetical protein
MAWPPTLDDLKLDMKITDGRDDARLQVVLDASIAFVREIHAGSYDFGDDILSELPAPDALMELGTMRLAGRWHTRRRSPDGLVAAGDLGTSRVPAVDADIARMLRIDRFRKSVVA